MIQEAISSGQFESAREAVLALLARDPTNPRTVDLFGQVHKELNLPGPVRDFVRAHDPNLGNLSTGAMVQLADVLVEDPTSLNLSLAKRR